MIVVNEYRILDDYAELITHSEKRGTVVFKIDIKNVDTCREHNWCANVYDKQYIYAVSRTAGLLHRFITKAEKSEYVDHINRDTLDNRESNLRATSPKMNAVNTGVRKNNKLGIKGVCIHKPTNKYMAHICHNRKKMTLGYFDELEDAINARRDAEIKYFGEVIKN